MRLIRFSLLAVALVVGMRVPAAAQTASTTTISANLSASAQTMVVSSATGFTVGNYAYLDAEAVQISAVNGTQIGIIRGQLGTVGAAHDNGERVITGALAIFRTVDPDYGSDCTRSQNPRPWINVLAARVWSCSAFDNSRWTATSTVNITYDSVPTSF